MTSIAVGMEHPSAAPPNDAVEKILLANDSSSCIIPFSRAGNLIVVKAKADTIEGNFILDTGAPNLVLNIIYFRDNPMCPGQKILRLFCWLLVPNQ